MSHWNNFLKEIEAVTKTVDEPFFRGHADPNWPLIPSLGRQKFHDNFENNVYYDFLTYGASLLPPSQSGF